MNTFKISGFLLSIVLHLFIGMIKCQADTKSGMSDMMVKMQAVKEKILKGYDKVIRPTKNGENATRVYTSMFPRQIIEVDEERGLFVMDSYFFMSWEDSRLAWNETTDGYSGWMPLPVDMLWVPDLTVHNSHSMSVNPAQLVPLTVHSSGNIFWVPPLFTQTSCPALMQTRYPGEEVECSIVLSSWVHDGWEIDYSHTEDLHINDFENINPRWELIASKARIVRHVVYYDGYDEPYVSIEIYLPMKRRPLPEIESTRSPCILVMLLTLSIFWLPPNSEKKIFVLGFMFLVLNVLLVYVAWSTRFPLGVLFAASFLQSTMYIVVVTFLLQVLVIFNLCNLSGPVRPPPAVMQLLTGPFGKYVCLRWSSNDDIPIDRIQLKEDSPGVIESPTPKDDWMLFAAGLDRLFFVLVSISMIAIHHL